MRISIHKVFLFVLMGSVLGGCASERMLELKTTPEVVTSPTCVHLRSLLSRSRLVHGGVLYRRSRGGEDASPRVGLSAFPLMAAMSNCRFWLNPAVRRTEFDVRFGLPPQPIDATHALNRSAGVSNPSVFRGRSFS